MIEMPASMFSKKVDAHHAVAADAVIDLLDRAVHQQLAALDDADRRAAIGQLGEDVARNEDRLAHPAKFLEEGLDLDPRAGIEAGGRLVEDQHRRIVDQRFRQAEPLLHAARKAVDERLALAGQIEQVEHVADDLLPPRAGQLVGHGEEVQKLPDLHAVIDAEIVGHVADAAADAPADRASRDAR